MLKRTLKRAANAAGLDIHRLRRGVSDARGVSVPDAELYQPLYCPWRSAAFMAEYDRIFPYTLVSADRCYVLASLAAQALRFDAEVWECGVYRGGTAMLIAKRLSSAARTLRLFDTFEGMPETDAAKDLHKRGDFSDTSLDAVRSRVSGDFIRFHQGLIPATFVGLEGSHISMAHVDVDIYSAVRACCEFIFPRLCIGGFMVFDDYGFPTCPGARTAVDEFFVGRSATPLVLPTGQAVVFKSMP
jgi:O-methyltransferase